jgi:hypothetical protein
VIARRSGEILAGGLGHEKPAHMRVEERRGACVGGKIVPRYRLTFNGMYTAKTCPSLDGGAQELTKTPRISAAIAASIVVPAIVADGGDQAARRIAAPAPG